MPRRERSHLLYRVAPLLVVPSLLGCQALLVPRVPSAPSPVEAPPAETLDTSDSALPGALTPTLFDACEGQPDLLAVTLPAHQWSDDGANTTPYTFGTIVAPVREQDQVFYQLGPLPDAELTLCIDVEITGGQGLGRTSVFENQPLWAVRWIWERNLPAGRTAECWTIPAVEEGFAVNQVGILRFEAPGAPEGYIVHGAALCESPDGS